VENSRHDDEKAEEYQLDEKTADDDLLAGMQGV
jgi:hypothetical protein